ncbi:MAG TPA: hypothetical protein V6D10_15405 [Trichocoleus sp.]
MIEPDRSHVLSIAIQPSIKPIKPIRLGRLQTMPIDRGSRLP